MCFLTSWSRDLLLSPRACVPTAIDLRGAAVVSMVFRMPAIAISLLALLIQAQAAKPPAFFKTPLTVQEMANKQAVVNTSAGTFVIDLRPDVAPNHVGYFMKLAKEGAYNGTIFHRVIKYGIVQGGDPLSKDPAKAKLYGTGGLGVLKAELNAEKETRGAVSAVLQPGKPDSAGAQFFVCVTDQAALDGKYTVFGRVSEGMDVVQKISEAPLATRRCDARRTHHDCDCRRSGTRRRRSRCRSRRTLPPHLSQYRAVLDTSAGPITIEFFGDKAPEHVRNFLRLAAAGVYDGTVVPSRREGIRDSDRSHDQPGTADGEAAEAGAQPAAGVQRHAARQRDRLDGARRRSGQRHDLVLHRHRGRRARWTASTRRSAGSSTAWRSSKRSSRRRSTARRRSTGSSSRA